jgi:hypothetical protein
MALRFSLVCCVLVVAGLAVAQPKDPGGNKPAKPSADLSKFHVKAHKHGYNKPAPVKTAPTPKKREKKYKTANPFLVTSHKFDPKETKETVKATPPAKSPPPEPVEEDVLKIRNRTPFLVTVYFGKVRAGWIKPFRTEAFRGLRSGYHKIFVTSHYGSATWGPTRVQVPGVWNLTPSKDSRSADEVETAIASRLYRRNRNSLVACDRLADRRGEGHRGSRFDFEIDVSEEGKPKVVAKGDKLSRRLQSCYLAVTKTWEYPSTGSTYTVTFQHMP